MKAHLPRWSSSSAASAAVLIVSFVGLTLPALRAQAIEPAPAAPVVLETSAVTLELVCRDAAWKASFIRSAAGCWRRRPGAAVRGRMPT